MLTLKPYRQRQGALQHTPPEASEQPHVHAQDIDGLPGAASRAQAPDSGMQSADPSTSFWQA